MGHKKKGKKKDDDDYQYETDNDDDEKPKQPTKRDTSVSNAATIDTSSKDEEHDITMLLLSLAAGPGPPTNMQPAAITAATRTDAHPAAPLETKPSPVEGASFVGSPSLQVPKVNATNFAERSDYLRSLFASGSTRSIKKRKPVALEVRAQLKGTRKVGTHPASEKQQMDEKVRKQFKLSLKHDEKLMNMMTPISKMDDFTADSWSNEELKQVCKQQS